MLKTKDIEKWSDKNLKSRFFKKTDIISFCVLCGFNQRQMTIVDLIIGIIFGRDQFSFVRVRPTLFDSVMLK